MTQVGIGAFVMNERREVLMVQERTGPLRGKGMWKLPTGLVNVGEDIRCAPAIGVCELMTDVKASGAAQPAHLAIKGDQ